MLGVYAAVRCCVFDKTGLNYAEPFGKGNDKGCHTF